MKTQPKHPEPIERIVAENRRMWEALARDIDLEPEELLPHFIVSSSGQAFRPL